MLVATVTETKNGLSALIDRVRTGESVLIIDRGIPVARLESAVSVTSETHGRIARLERSGALKSAQKAPAVDTLSSRPPSTERGASALAALLEERRRAR